jgi:hypothetical protein
MEVNAGTFTEWVFNKGLPYLMPRPFVTMVKTHYHSIVLDKAQITQTRKNEIVVCLCSNCTSLCTDMGRVIRIYKREQTKAQNI